MIIDARTNKIYDYTRRFGLESSFIVAPEISPKWAQNRETLWNKVETVENRKNSMLAREIRIALPDEFNAEQRELASRELAASISKKYKTVCDVSIHKPDKHGDERNFHTHILMTTRRVDENGFTEKTREFNDKRQSVNEIKYIRQEWETVANRNLVKTGHKTQIDCRSYEDQGIDKEPTIHIGKDATQLERRGVLTKVGDKNRHIKERNLERAGLKLDREQALAEIGSVDNKINQINAELEIEERRAEHQPAQGMKDGEAAVEQVKPENHDEALVILMKIQDNPLLKLDRKVAYSTVSLMKYYYEPGPGMKSGMIIEREEIQTLKSELDRNKKWLSNADENLAGLKARAEKEEAVARPVIEEARCRWERMSPKERELFEQGGALEGISSRDDLTMKQKIFLSENVKGYIGLERRTGHLERAAITVKKNYDEAKKRPGELPSRIEYLQRKIASMEKRLKVVGGSAIRETWEAMRRELQTGKPRPGQEPLIMPEPEWEAKERKRHRGMGR